jgi:zinc transporter 10
MAVCVVCLLCAEHLPCKQHVLASQISDERGNDLSYSAGTLGKGINLLTQDIAYESYVYDKRKEKTKDEMLVRTKRHANHGSHTSQNNNHINDHHHFEIPHVTKNYLKMIFSYFGNDTNKMNLKGFTEMLKKLDLGNIFKKSSRENDTCLNEESFLYRMTGSEKFDHEPDDHDHVDHNLVDHDHNHVDHDHSHDLHHEHEEEYELSVDNMVSICPILLYYAMKTDVNPCLNSSSFSAIETSVGGVEDQMEDKTLVWLYSTLAIVLVSLCGLFGVAVIPVMEKHFYHHVLQFLVALAVGTLCGDALLHLLPHAMLPLENHPDQDLHMSMTYRGLAAMFGIIFFYFFERFIAMVMELRQRKEKRDKPSSRVRVMRDPETVSLNTVTTCKHKYSSYPYCYDEIAMETKDDHHEHQHVNNDGLLNNRKDLLIVSPTDAKKFNGSAIVDSNNEMDTNTLTLSTSLEDGSIESNALFNNNKQMMSSTKNNLLKQEPMQDENYTIILRY